MLRGKQAQAALSWCFNALSGQAAAPSPAATLPSKRCIGQLALANNTLIAGASGRQGVSGVVATVFGSTGFLGRYVVSAIGERGGRVVCPHRCDDMDMQHLRPMGDLGNIITLHDFSIRDDDLIRSTISKSNVVVNLIGHNVETWNFGFKEVHEDFPAKLARMCAETPSVERFIQVSCLGADTRSPSTRLASKAVGDEAVMQAFPNATLLRCGPMVGVEDRFYNDLALWRYSNYGVPVVDGGLNEVQSVYVTDVAEALYKSLEFHEAKGATYELAGNERMQMKDLAVVICDEMKEDVKLRQVPSFFAGPLASARTWLTKRLPLHMLTRDVIITPANVQESTVDKVVSPGAKTFKDLHVVPHKTTSGVAIDHVRFWRKGGYNQGTNADIGSM